MQLTLSAAELAGTLIQSLLFGVYILLFIASIYVLTANRRRTSDKAAYRPPVNKTLFTISISLFLLIASHWVISISRLFPAFIYDDYAIGDSDVYLGSAGNPVYVAKIALYVAQMVVADITMVYRLYTVWGHSWRVIIAPVITTATLLTAGIGAVDSFSRIPKGLSMFAGKSSGWIATVFGASLATNAIVTASITYRIWSINRNIPSLSSDRLTKVTVIILESAALYTVCLIVTHVSYLVKINFDYVALDVTSPAIGIACSLIIVRVGLGWATENSHHHRRSGVFSNITLPPMAVHVSRQVNTDTAAVDEEAQSSQRDLSSEATI
ncbi:hypothetical protein BJ138DRAFT_1112284 [Hygrophoropsis aurantiaca]|uniref:Uncharacterized protein n=1 Tax=Hygrophoropsis aurantiaca TaxID=72124 RepID=A0ACB8AH48_9AGAM|nr:hypothetical protein BJ138DRAFT_1112284 [Hygrophoropsis aurantiaca]